MKKNRLIPAIHLLIAAQSPGFLFGLHTDPFIHYTETAGWSSKTVNSASIVTVCSNATVTLDQDAEAGSLRIGTGASAGTLSANLPFRLDLVHSVAVSNGWLEVGGGTVATPFLGTAPAGSVEVAGGSLHVDDVVNDGTISVNGGLLAARTEGLSQPAWVVDRFCGEDQTSFATNDAEVARQIGRFWKRCNPADTETQYRVFGGKLDIGAVSPHIVQKASLVNTRAETVGKDGETGYRLSAVMQQDHQAGTGYMGLVFHYRDDGSYYLFRVNGVGSVQVLVYSQFVQSGVVLNVAEAFAPVRNRLYRLSVESVGLYAFNLAIEDTVSGATVYSKNNLTVGGSFLKLADGIGGVYATSGVAGVDTFELSALPAQERFSLMDGFADRSQGSWATNDAQIALQIGSAWKRCNPADEISQYRIHDGKLDVGAQSPSDQKASLVNTAVQTSADGFRLSVVQQQDTLTGSAFMGLVFNYQDDGSYYLLRISGAGWIQFLVFSQYVRQGGTVLNVNAFFPVQNRPYKLCVESSAPYAFGISVIDMVTGEVVYSNDAVTVGGSFVQLQDGLAGVYATHGFSLFDNFSLDIVPASSNRSVSGAGGFDIQSGTVSLAGDSVSHLALNAGLFNVSGGNVSLGQLSVGTGAPAEFRVTGNAAGIHLSSLNQGFGAAESGTFRFVFGAGGVGPVGVSSWMDLGAARLVVDGSAYVGGPARFTLFDSELLVVPLVGTNAAIHGFDGPYEARLEQDFKRVELVVAPPDPFEDATAELGMEAMAAGGSACWFDLNNDGWMDLAVGGRLWINQGGTSFVQGQWVGQVVAADFDNDGWTDLYSHSSRRLFRNNQGTLVEDVALPAFPNPYVSLGACWGDFDNDGWVDLYITGFENWEAGITYPDLVLMNNNGQSFTLSTISSAYRARGVTACDFDQDHDLDVYVSNYRLQPNLLWRNGGSGNFSNVASAYNALAGNGHSIGACWGDFDNDGLFDLFAGNFAHPGQPESRFLRNRGPAFGHHFEDMGTGGIFFQESYASPAAGDYDNDGRLDLFFTTVYEIATGGIPNYPVLFRNEGSFEFQALEADSIAELPATYQAAWGDFDNDGHLDLLTAGKLFRNRGLSGNNWLKVRLLGDGIAVNRSAIGAQVRIPLGSETLARQVEAGTGQGNQNALELHFGLGAHTNAVDVEISWPDGSMQILPGVAPNQAINVGYAE